MSNRWLRFGIAVLAIGAASAAGFRIYQHQQRLAISIERARNTDGAAESALTTIPETKAALHAYVADGQGVAFWTARAAMLLERLRASMLELDGAASAVGVSLTEPLELVEKLVASEQRAREHVRAGQRLLAGEVIFTEARDTLDALRLQLAAARTSIAESEAATQTQMRRDQAMLALASAGILSLAVLLLAIPTHAAPVIAASAIKSAARPSDEFESSARIVSRVPLKPTPPGATAGASPSSAAAPKPTASLPAAPDRQAGAPKASQDSKESEAATVTPPMLSLREAAAICTELGRASQSIEVSNLLARAAKLLEASGAIVWMTSADGRELYPAAATGYDDRLLTRIGAIPRTANNVTASAIRTGTARTSPRVGQSAAALAVPLLTPLGAVGVLSAEMKTVPEVDETRLAVATIFAAQLAGLVGSRATASATSSNAKANAVT